MSKHRINPYLIKITAGCALLILGAVLGGFGMYRHIGHQDKMSNVREDMNTKLITDKIAIVNLDEGVMVQDEKINYAERLLINLRDNFLFTGLEDARQGYTTGIYAGYMIIPANFSSSVVSLNDTPVRAQISYAINNKLQEDVKEQVIYDVLEMVNNLGDNVSYMYMHSILDDLHTAQDEAGKIMRNDLKEKEAIDAVQAYDLVALVPVTELTEIENTIEPVDISEYMARNAEFAEEVGLKYSEYLMESETDHQQINEEAIGLMDEMGNMEGIISDISFVEEGEDGSVYQSGLQELDLIFEEYNLGVVETIAEQGENIMEIYRDINLYLDEHGRALEAHESWNYTLYQNMLNEVTALFNHYREQGYLIVHESEIQRMRDDIQSKQNEIERMQDEIESKQDEIGRMQNELQSKDDKIQHMGGEIAALNKTIAELQSRIEELEEELGGEVEPSDEAEFHHMMLYVDTGINALGSGGNMTGEDSTGDENKDDGSDKDNEDDENNEDHERDEDGEDNNGDEDEIEELDLTKLQESIIQILEENNDYNFKDLLLDEEGNMMQDEEGEYIPVTSILKPYEKELYLNDGEPDESTWEEILEEQVAEFEFMDMERITACLDEQIIMPIQANIESVVTAVLDQYAVEQEQLMAYNEAIMAYNPLEYIDHNEMQLLTDQMMDNGVALSEAVLDTDIQQLEYVTDVYEATREDLFTLQDNIATAKEDSDKAVEEGLQELKDTKNANSVLNQQILDDFSNKLPYTRLGSLEYVQAYEFMVNPIGSIDIEQGESRKRTQQQDSVRSADDNLNVEERKGADIQNISILMCVMICVIIVAATIKYHFHKKEEFYELE